jgi:nicotinamide-nucleotide amidase
MTAGSHSEWPATVADPDERIPTDSQVRDWCEQLANLAQAHGVAIATAESLTSGNLASELGRASGSGDWYCGGIVAYRKAVKHSLLNVPNGPVVSADAARAMAYTSATLMGANVALAVTGEAGPECQEDVPPGTVWFGIYDHGVVRTEHRRFNGEPEDILAKTIATSVQLLLALADPAASSSTMPDQKEK